MKKEYLKIFDDRDKTTIDFDKKHEKFFKYIDTKINLITYEYMQIITKKPNIVIKKKDSMFLIFKTIEYFISAISLLRQRAFFEAGTILRMTIETAATAYHINADKEAFIRYKNNNYNSTKAIGFTKNKITSFGSFWGDLSKLFVHINTYHGIISSIWEENDNKYIYERGNINFGVKEEEKIIEAPMIILSKISICFLYRFFELIFYNDVIYLGHKGKHQPETNILKLGAMVEKEIKNLLDDLKELT